MAVTPFIIDNAVMVGVGNINATEALFAAGIDPRREAKSISWARYLKLAVEIKRILAAAIAPLHQHDALAEQPDIQVCLGTTG